MGGLLEKFWKFETRNTKDTTARTEISFTPYPSSDTGDLLLKYADSGEDEIGHIIRNYSTYVSKGQDIPLEVSVRIKSGTESFELEGLTVNVKQGSSKLHTGSRHDGGYLYRRITIHPLVSQNTQGQFQKPIRSPAEASCSNDRGKIQILDFKWRDTLKPFQRVTLRSVGVSKDMLLALRRELPALVENENCSCTCIAVVVTSRVQSDAEMALEQFNINPGEGDNTILLMLHQVAGSKTIADVQLICYENNDVYATLHVPFKKCY